MERITRLSAEQRDNLAAYLDGELGEGEAVEIEQILSKSPVARHEVEMLTRTWEMLDLLDQPRAPENFSERTLATVKLEETRTGRPLVSRAWAERLRRGVILTGCAAAVALAAVLGFLATYRWVPQEYDLLVDDYPVIRRLDLYRDVHDAEFLRGLEDRGLLLDDAGSEGL